MNNPLNQPKHGSPAGMVSTAVSSLILRCRFLVHSQLLTAIGSVEGIRFQWSDQHGRVAVPDMEIVGGRLE